MGAKKQSKAPTTEQNFAAALRSPVDVFYFIGLLGYALYTRVVR
jgi:hypothetical protein